MSEDKFKLFGCNVFKEEILKRYLSPKSFERYKNIVENKLPLDENIAKEVAVIMKNWAIEKGATHYSHWFQPLNGITAEKQISFLSLSLDSELILDFPVESLIVGEADASSFPSGGLRSVFEARGCTRWDYTAPAFLKENSTGKVLCIPTIFESAKGESLDKRTPLLNSCDALEKETLRMLSLFGNNTTKEIFATVGAEQEYFLIKKDVFSKRKDLVLTGRTLFGEELPKSMNKHYLSSINENIGKFMCKVEEELWKIGIPAKIKHNEVALHQYELVPYFENVYLSTNHDHLIMEILKREAEKSGYICLLHEKPFKGLNGSGKHNNWSIYTKEGENLFKYGDTPIENARFITMIVALIAAVDKYSDLIRATIATASNDIRLSGFEAPSSIVSMYIGKELTTILEKIMNGSDKIKLGTSDLKLTDKFITDRNRTSPFAFVGNRFEFRMPGSSSSIAVCNTVLNTVMAESLSNIVDELKDSKDFYTDLQNLLAKMLEQHFKVIYNGNAYSEEWIKEAEERGLSNLKHAPDAFKAFINKDSIQLFSKYNVYSKEELFARYDIKMGKYIKFINTEADVILNIAEEDIIPACIKYSNCLSDSILHAKQIGLISTEIEEELLKNIREKMNSLYKKISNLKKELKEKTKISDIDEKANYYQESVRKEIEDIREDIDYLEGLVSKEYWPFPTYFDMLMS